jgi:hypothetical protein
VDMEWIWIHMLISWYGLNTCSWLHKHKLTGRYELISYG